MRRPVEAFKITCDGCQEQFESFDFTIFTADWPLEESGWQSVGVIDLCFECQATLGSLAELITGIEP